MQDPKDQLAAVGDEPPAFAEARSLDLVQFMRRQIAWSAETFGPGYRTAGLLDHIENELVEVANASTEDDDGSAELREWADVVILALDAMWRAGATPERVCRELLAKAEINRGRRWPDWRTAEPGRAIGHVRTEDESDGEEALGDIPT